jgi:dihydrofolate synthase/folylpolyglutamate synthase
VSRQPPEAVEIIEKTAASLDAPLYMEGMDFSASGENYPAFTFRGRRSSLGGLRCGLLGRHQVQNSAVALAAAEVIEEAGCRIGEQAKRDGVRYVRWPARMELIEGNPPIVIDGTHNVGGAVVLARELPEEFPGKPTHLLMGMQVTKDLAGFIEALAPALTMVHAVPIREAQCYTPEKIADQAKFSGLSCRAYGSVGEGLDGAMGAARDKGIVLVAGSLYLAGEVGEMIGGPKN